jgi:GxxExxY protein
MAGMEYKYSDITKLIIRAAMNVHAILGNGFQEAIYQKALAVEFRLMGIDFGKEISIPIYYKNELLGTRRVDFLVENLISVELKATSVLDNAHLNQGLNYLEAFNLEVGLLINFGAKSLEWKRLYNSKFNPNI